jgi:hypothetical protein
MPTERQHLILRVGGAFAVLNLAWEVAQLTLYTIRWIDPPARIAFAVIHCTGGDLMIGDFSLAPALLIVVGGWPENAASRRQVIVLTTLFGVGYTVFSEWLNVEVRQTWAYSEAMPQLPPLGTGLTPVLQWVLLPRLALLWAYRNSARRPATASASSPSRSQQPR